MSSLGDHVLRRKMSKHVASFVVGCSFDFGSFDAEYPLEVDDEFWENDDSQLAFTQPSDKPSTVVAFNLWLRLTDFAASTLQRLVGALFCSLFVSSFV